MKRSTLMMTALLAFAFGAASVAAQEAAKATAPAPAAAAAAPAQEGQPAAAAGEGESSGKEKGEEDGYAINLTEEKAYLHVIHQGKSVKIQRVQDPNYELKGYFAKTGRKCPPFCLQPEHADTRVATVGELEVFSFMEKQLRDQTGILIDARTPSWYQKGTIPGSVNIPFTALTKKPDDPEMVAILQQFGAKPRGEVGMVEKTLEDWGLSSNPYLTAKWDFTQAKELMLWCNGPACGQSPRAIHGLLEAGYPSDKIFYYRGGMQIWQLFGLTTVIPEG